MYRKIFVTLAVLFGALWMAFSATNAFATPITPSTPDDSPGDHSTVDQCAATAPGTAHCLAVRRTDPGSVHPNLTPNTTPAGYSPANLHAAYNLPSTGGAGTTVAIIDAYDNPHAEADLATYRAQYGLPACTTANGCFRTINQTGATSPLPAASTAWAGEIDLDIQMVSAISPNSHILLVEANSASFGDLGAAVNAAVAAGAKFVSNSYGGSEYSGETGADASFYRHPGVVITASTGDDGYGIAYPASSPYVTAVGGTSLHTASNARGWSETAWTGAGSGCSAYEPKPAFQTGVATGCGNRANADVSAVADPNTGVAVYQSYGGTGWVVYGGTSVAAPIIASVYALAGTPAATDSPVTYPYAHPAGLNDVTSGSNGTCSTAVWCTARTGWDGPTGLGTPHGLSAFTPTTTTGGGGSGGGTPTPPVTCTAPGQKLGNPGFETGTAGPWTTTPGVVTTAGYGRTPHTGSYFAWLDGYGATHTDTLAQTVTIPAGCHASLSFWLHTDTAETTTAVNDTLTVQVGGTTVASFSNRSAAAGYQQHTYDVSAFAGQTVTVKFTGTENGSLQTSFLVDDTALSAS